MSEYFQQIDPRFSQCDLIEFAPHSRLPHPIIPVRLTGSGVYEPTEEALPERVVSDLRIGTAMLITADCDLDKPSTKFWHICPVHQLSQLNNPDQTNVRKNKFVKFMHLPAFDGLAESFVDFSSLTTVSKEVVQTGKRITTLSDMGRQAFYLQFTRWVTRWTLETLDCPSCGTTFNPADVLPVRAD